MKTNLRRPRTSEVVIISVLITLAVVSRAVFFMLPQIKPLVAIVIISGICLGWGNGFLVGAMSAFVSNFIFGQGPWTPFQMMALGLAGLAAGLLIRWDVMKKPLALSVSGAFITLIIYGGIVDLWTILSFTPEPTFGLVIAIYAAALPMNVILSAATAVFLFFFGRPFIDKIERVKLKYGVFGVYDV